MSRVHGNPANIVLLGNPPGRRHGELMSNDVLGIFYRHVEDGRLYAHTFGQDVDTMLGSDGRVIFAATTPRPRSGIQMLALGDKQIVLQAKDGHNISEDF